MDRTPLVFEEKVSWKLDEVDSPGARECENYISLEGHIEEVERLFREEEKLGWMVAVLDSLHHRRWSRNPGRYGSCMTDRTVCTSTTRSGLGIRSGPWVQAS